MSEKNDEEKEQEKENSIKFENIKKINNPTNSSQTSTTKTIHDIYNDKVELEKYLKENCPEFWEKFELLEFNKNGSAGAVLKAQTRSKENKKNRRFVALKFLYNGKKNNKPKKEINHQEIIIL